VDIVIYSAYQLFGECLESYLKSQRDVDVVAVVHDTDGVRAVLERLTVDLLLVDVAPGFDALHIAAISDDYPGLALLAVGLAEHDTEVLQCGRAGFAGYVPRDASLQSLHTRMQQCLSGRLTCPETIAASLLRALHAGDAGRAPTTIDATIELMPSKLSPREAGVARLLRRGLSNKEIARELDLSVATVKHHVHSILDKLGLPGRVHVMRTEPDPSWGLDVPQRIASVHRLKRA
jgi:DNA-binding NarL/FixJ family response regulator